MQCADVLGWKCNLDFKAASVQAGVTPIIHCWETNSNPGETGIIFYVGANNNGNKLDIASGNLNYMSEGQFPPSFFPAGMAGFLHRYVYTKTNPDLTWTLNDGATNWVVHLAASAVQKQCPQGVPIVMTLTYETSVDFNTINQTTAQTAIIAALASYSGLPAANFKNAAFAPTQNPTGFTMTIELTAGAAGTVSIYTAAAKMSMQAGEHATNDFTNALNAAVGVTPISLAHIFSAGTSVDTVGAPIVPVAPTAQTTPTAPVPLPPKPLIPFADCWEQRSNVLSLYFGYNNTGSAPVHVSAGPTNIVKTYPQGQVVSGSQVATTFPPGFSSFAFAVNIQVVPINTPDYMWTLLNHEVKMLTKGVNQECKQLDNAVVWIKFRGAAAKAVSKIADIKDLIIQYLPGLTLANFQAMVSGDTDFRIEVTFSQGGAKTQYAFASLLYAAFYTSPDFPTQLQALTEAEPISLNGLPTRTETQGHAKLTPHGPVALPPDWWVPILAPKPLSGGAIFGIIVAVIAGIALLVGVFLYLRSRPAVPGSGRGYEKLIQ